MNFVLGFLLGLVCGFLLATAMFILVAGGMFAQVLPFMEKLWVRKYNKLMGKLK